MIELPAALAPWAAELSLLAPDLALTLAPWVGRLAVALGPMSAHRTPGAGEPDGYGGLSRRGSYERLVTAEWALADLYPDEFVRRASAGEHLFLDLARRAPQGSRRAVAVVSAGPSQLGAPRLAHLAALIVLSRRAASAGADFAWGLLEDPGHTLTTGLDAAGVRRLLDGRTARTAGASAITGWREQVGGRTDAVDWWLIGGPELVAAGRAASASCIAVRDLLEPGIRAVEVEVVRTAATARVRLALPAPEVAARLLRDPLAHGGGARVGTLREAAHQLRFVARGQKLLVHGVDGAITTWPVPGSPRAPLGQPRTWSRWGELVAVGMHGRRLESVWFDPREPSALSLAVGNVAPKVRAQMPPETAAELQAQSGRGAPIAVGDCASMRLRSGTIDLVLHGPLDRMYLIAGAGLPPDGVPAVRGALVATPFVVGLPDARVVSTLLRERDALWAQIDPHGTVEIVRLTEAGTAVVARVATEPAPGALPAIHWGRHQAQSLFWGPVAVAVGGPRWTVLHASRPAREAVVGEPVVAVIAADDGEPAFLTRSGDRRLVLGSGTERIALVVSTAPIVEVVASGFESRIAWRTSDGEIVVYSLQHRAVLMRLAPRDGRWVPG